MAATLLAWLFTASAAVLANEGERSTGPVTVAMQQGFPVRLVTAHVTTHGAVVDYEVTYTVNESRLVRGIEWGYVLLDSGCQPVLEGVATDQVYPRVLSQPEAARTLRGSTNIGVTEKELNLATSWHFFYLLGVEMLDGSRHLGDLEDIAAQLQGTLEQCLRAKRGTAGPPAGEPRSSPEEGQARDPAETPP